MDSRSKSNEETTYAKEQLGSAAGECKLLGLSWNKRDDTISVSFPEEIVEPTKREVLGKLPRIYDPLGLVSPMSLQGKMIFREACETKISWDTVLPDKLSKLWASWESNLPASVSTKRSLVAYEEPIDALELHSFGDTSRRGVAAVVYAVVKQASRITQGLVVAKSQLAKQGLTIPRLELVAGHMASNMIDNVRRISGDWYLLLARQHCGFALDPWRRGVSTVCGKPCSEDPEASNKRLDACTDG